MIFAVVAVVIVAFASIGVYAIVNKPAELDKTSKDFDNTRLRIYGNANGDDYIDNTDVEIIKWIIDNNNDESKEKIDWKTKYPLADANYDDKLDNSDVEVTEKIVKKESTKMYYYNFYKRVTYVNYPISDKIGAEYLILQLLPAIKSYSMLKAIDSDSTPVNYANVYPGVDTLPTMGNMGEITIDSLNNLYNNGTIGTFMQWTGGQNTDYLWDSAVESGLADKMSFVIVPCQGPDVIQGVLELACMLGNQKLSEDYKKWYDEAMDLLDSIEEKVGEKKTITAVRCYQKAATGISAFGGKQGPALWFNKVINFQDEVKDKTNFYNLGSIESFKEYATDEVIVMFQKDCDWSEFNAWVEEYLGAVYGASNVDQFKNEKMYCVDFELMPFSGGPAGCYILAAHLYPELFDFDKALDFLQYYLDNFAVRPGADAHAGYTYTGEGYSN